MDRHVIIFARYPEPHRTKTRLIPALGPEGAAQLQLEMTRHTLRWARQLRNDLDLSVEVRFAGGDEAAMRSCFGRDFFYHSQGPGDLGARMLRALQDGCHSGAQRTVIIGTDCPDITPQRILTAFDRLTDHDLVIGPATDGGYYLIGLRQPVAELFSDISWGGDRVLRDTMQRAESRHLCTSLLEPLPDIDRPEDLPVWQRARCPQAATMDARISVIIPTLNESACLQDTLSIFRTAENVETIVVDGGSHDGTDKLATAVASKFISSSAGRSRQMNTGAVAASGEILLFLHADTRLPDRFDQYIRAALCEPDLVAGAFRIHIAGTEQALRLIEWGTNLRSRYLQAPYGDQAIFLRTETFQQLGGFKELPIMEDYEFVQRLRRHGRVAILPEAITTSARRWQSLGPWKTTWINQKVILGYHCGVSVKRLARWYAQSQPAADRPLPVIRTEQDI